jgi:hypothetical protein
MRTTTQITFLCLAGLTLSGALQGSTIIAHFDQQFTPELIDRTVDNGANTYTTDTGLFKFTRTGGTFTGFQVGAFYAFCIEPREFVSVGTTYTYDWSVLEQGTTNIGGMGTAKANLLRELFGRYFPDFSASIDNVHASALQIATWEIVRETSGTLNVLTGTTRFSNPTDAAALTLAQTYVQSLDGTGPMLHNVLALTAVGAQDLIIQDRIQSEVPTPEPAGTALAGLALIGVALVRRRR